MSKTCPNSAGPKSNRHLHLHKGGGTCTMKTSSNPHLWNSSVSGLTTSKELSWKWVARTPPKSARNIFISLLHIQVVTQLPIFRAIPWFLNPLTVVATAAASLCRRRVVLNWPFGAGPSWQWMQEEKEVEKEKGRGDGTQEDERWSEKGEGKSLSGFQFC